MYKDNVKTAENTLYFEQMRSPYLPRSNVSKSLINGCLWKKCQSSDELSWNWWILNELCFFSLLYRIIDHILKHSPVKIISFTACVHRISSFSVLRGRSGTSWCSSSSHRKWGRAPAQPRRASQRWTTPHKYWINNHAGSEALQTCFPPPPQLTDRLRPTRARTKRRTDRWTDRRATHGPSDRQGET